jgi:hypothetical protein
MVVLVILRSEKRIRVENYEAMEPFFGSDEPPQTDDVLPYIAVPYSAVWYRDPVHMYDTSPMA